jgi:hypothetical protein
MIRQPWQKKKMILSSNIPNSRDVVELWEKPYWCFGFEYETWFVVKFHSGKENSYLLEKYIPFEKVLLFISSDYSIIRVETNQPDPHYFYTAEYDLNKKTLKTKTEESIKNKEGWILIKEQVIR